MHVGHGHARPASVARHQQQVFRHAQRVRKPRRRLGTHESHVRREYSIYIYYIYIRYISTCSISSANPKTVFTI